MHRFPQWLRTLLFLIGVAGLVSAAGVVYSFSFVERFDASSKQELPTLTLCELLTNPKAYDMRVVRVRAVLVVNDGDRSLYDASCTTMEPMVGVEPDPSLRHQPGDQVAEQFYDLVQPENKITEASARMVMVGRFEGPNFFKDGRKSKFQHQLIIMRIEEAESDASSPNPNTPASQSVTSIANQGAETVSFCDLVSSPELYASKTIRLQTIAVATFELSFLYDPQCNREQSWIDLQFDSPQTLEKVGPLLDFSRGRHTPRRARVTLVGRFDGPSEEGYGHLNSFRFHFYAVAVEKAEAVSAEVPRPWDELAGSPGQ